MSPMAGCDKHFIYNNGASFTKENKQQIKINNIFANLTNQTVLRIGLFSLPDDFT